MSSKVAIDSHRTGEAIKWGIVATFTVSFIWFVMTASIGWNNGLSDVHGFRQTQTAITSYYIAHGGSFLRYETPVFGAPWSIPFEFPLYQWVVAVVSNAFGTPLDQTGRFVSEIFFGLTLISLWSLLSELGIRRLHRLVFLSLILVSPLYVFWSRTFMIESTALCLCMTFLLFMVRYGRTRRARDFMLAGLFGVAGAIVKATTFPAFALAGGLFCIFMLNSSAHERKAGDFVGLVRGNFFIPALIGGPLFIALLWVRYTDQVKQLNGLGTTLTSYNLRPWNFGPFSQKFAAETWIVFFWRIIPDVSGMSLVIILPIVIFFLMRDGARLKPFLICAGSFLAPFLIFTNLHYVHSYYSYANGVFLIMAFSWCIIALLEQKERYRYLGMGALFICVAISMGTYYDRYSFVQRQPQTSMTGAVKAIKGVTREDDVLVIYGLDWSSEIPYYSQRRALMWPAFMKQDFKDPQLESSLENLKGQHIGALVVAKTYHDKNQLIEDTLTGLNLESKPAYEDGFCVVYPARLRVAPE